MVSGIMIKIERFRLLALSRLSRESTGKMNRIQVGNEPDGVLPSDFYLLLMVSRARQYLSGPQRSLISCAFLILLIDNLNDNENIFYINEWGTMGIGKEAKQNAILEEKDKKQHRKVCLPDKNAIKLEKVYSKYGLISTNDKLIHSGDIQKCLFGYAMY